MTDRIDIHDPVFDICHRLGLEPNNVAELTIRPRDVVATVYKLNANDAKYMEQTSENLPYGRAAIEIKTFEVATHKVEAHA